MANFKSIKEELATLDIDLEYRRTCCGMEYIFTCGSEKAKTHNRLGLKDAIGEIYRNKLNNRPLLSGIG
ncbi:hypothetical protein AN1V17_41900 [Vallitalea sediminicola]